MQDLTRVELGKRNGERATFRGTFARFGTKPGWGGTSDQTILLTDIRDSHGNEVCDHLWFNCTKAFSALNLQPGDVVDFDARVGEYVKGYFGRRIDVYKPTAVDYRLSYPTHVRKVSNNS